MWLLDELKKRKDSTDPALIHRDEVLTYKELWNRSEMLAQYIAENAGSKAPVLIYGNKDVRIVEVMIASLKTGRAYVPVDVTFPVERVDKIAKKTNAELLFDLSGVDNVFACINVIDGKMTDLICSGNGDCEDSGSISRKDWVDGDDNCYILFTSGSTGEPKGVQISKDNIINFVTWFEKQAGVRGDVTLNQVSYSFDVSVIQLYIYLPMGKALYCIDKEMIADFGVLFDHLKGSGISSWVSTPAFIEMCAVYDNFRRDLLPNLEKIILAGEVLTKKLVRTLWERFPGVKVINGYGPTEGTVLLASCTIDEKMVEDDDNELPIGYLLDGADYSIDVSVRESMDDAEEPGDGKGELIVESASISKGYYGDPETTAKSFFVNSGSTYRSYRTGDIVYEHNGMIYYCGRKDFQVKLNGYRIELDDISENINRIDGVSNSVVLPVYRDGRVAYIASFVTMDKDMELSGARATVYIRKALGKMVPKYMLPKKIVTLDSFPLNTNGKIDRKLLMEKYL